MLKSLENLKDGQTTTNIFIFIGCHCFTKLETCYMKLICRMLKDSLGEKKKTLIKKKIQDFNLFETNPQKSSSFTLYLNFLLSFNLILKFKEKISNRPNSLVIDDKLDIYIIYLITKNFFTRMIRKIYMILQNKFY